MQAGAHLDVGPVHLHVHHVDPVVFLDQMGRHTDAMLTVP